MDGKGGITKETVRVHFPDLPEEIEKGIPGLGHAECYEIFKETYILYSTHR